MAKFWEFAKGHPAVFEYMPDEEDRDALPRAWVINVFYTVLKDKFSKYVEDQMDKRIKERAKEQNSEAVMHPKFYQAFRESKDVSGILFKPADPVNYKLKLYFFRIVVKGLGADMLK
jgi:hypothetical protein